MRIYNGAYGALNESTTTRPRYVFKIDFSDDPTDAVWIRSHSDITITEPGAVLDARAKSITSLSQKLNLSNGNATIGKMTFSAVDINESLTDYQRAQLLNENHGNRWQNVQFYHGYAELDFQFYELKATQILQSVSDKGGEYKFRCADIQRRLRTQVFDALEMRLALPLDAEATTVELLSTIGLQAVQHDDGFTDAAGETVVYVKIDDEIIRVPEAGIEPTRLVGVTRGVLGTRAEEHTTDEDSAKEAKKVTEVVYLEGPFTRIAYAVLTGNLFGQAGTLPDSWHLGIPPQYIRQADFLEIGDDWFDPNNSTLGLPVRFINPGKTDGKRWIEKEICRVFSAFMPVDINGALGWRRVQPVLAGAAPVGVIDDSMLRSGQIEIRYDYESIINRLTLEWNEIDGDLRRSLRLDDEASIAKWQLSEDTFQARGLSGSRYTDDAIAAILERFRDRYGNPPITTTITVLGAHSQYEVGDVIRLRTDTARLFTEDPPADIALDHAFEIQSVKFNPLAGTVTYGLFGSSADAGPLPAAFGQTAIPDAFYTAQGTNGATLAGVTFANGSYTFTQSVTIAGAANNSNAIYYFNADVIIPQGVTVSYTQNVQLRIRGVLQVIGELNGSALGLSGAADTASVGSIPALGVGESVLSAPPATSPGVPAFLGTTQPTGALIERTRRRSGSTSRYRYTGQSVFGTVTQGRYGAMPGFYVRWQDGQLRGVPADLRGTSGGAGGYFYWNDSRDGVTYTARGGQGGAGGAGLLIICRGMTFGASGLVRSSGADGQPGQTGGPLGTAGAGLTGYAGTGAGGAPGGTLVIIDGPANPIPVKFGHVEADYGLSEMPEAANRLEDAYVTKGDTRFADPDLDVEGAELPDDRASYFGSASSGVRLGTGAFRAVLALPDVEAIDDRTDAAIAADQQISVSVTEAYDDRDDPRVTLLKATVTRTGVGAAYGSAAIYYRVLGTQQFYRAGYAEDTLDFELPADGRTYEVEARPVLVNGLEADSGFAATALVTDSNRVSAAPDAIIPAPLVNGGVLKILVTNTLVKPDVAQVFRSQTQGDASPALIDTVPLFFVLADNAFCADYVTAQLTGGESYYYWAVAVNEQGATARFPATNGVELVPDIGGGGGAPGTPGVDAVSGTVARFEWVQTAPGQFSATSPQNLAWAFSRGTTGGIASGTVQAIRSSAGVITNIQSIGTSGEAVTTGAPVGLGTESAYVEITHDQTGQKALCVFVVLTNGEDGQDGVGVVNLMPFGYGQFDALTSAAISQSIGGFQTVESVAGAAYVGRNYVRLEGSANGAGFYTTPQAGGLGALVGRLAPRRRYIAIAWVRSYSGNQNFNVQLLTNSDGTTATNQLRDPATSQRVIAQTGAYIKTAFEFDLRTVSDTLFAMRLYSNTLGAGQAIHIDGLALYDVTTLPDINETTALTELPDYVQPAEGGPAGSDGEKGDKGDKGDPGDTGGVGPQAPPPITEAASIFNDGSVTHASEGGAILVELRGALEGFSNTAPGTTGTLDLTRNGQSLPGFPQQRSIQNVFDSQLGTNSWSVNPNGSLNVSLVVTPGAGNQVFAFSWSGLDFSTGIALTTREERS